MVGSLVISLISVQLQNYSFKNLPSKRATTFDLTLLNGLSAEDF